jgi:SAM-dependent methyltransferase
MRDEYRREPPEIFAPLSPTDYARFYALEMTGHEEDVAFYRHFLGQGETLLEVGCGDGRLARRLAALGHTVVGIDTSLAMLRRATDPAQPGFTVAAMDMRSLAFSRHFSAAIIAHNTLNLLPGEAAVRQTLTACRAALQPDGRLLLHLFLPETPPPPEKRMQFAIMPLPEGGQLLKEIVRHYAPDGESMVLIERYKYRPSGGGAAFANYRQEMRLLAWPPERWRQLFREIGWRVDFFSTDDRQRFPFAAGRALLVVLFAGDVERN